MNTQPEITPDLPGYELVSKGLADLSAGQFDTIEALLIGIGTHRLRRLGFSLPAQCPVESKYALYDKLGERHGNAAHSKYNALIRRLISFARSMESRNTKNRQSRTES